MRRKFHVCERFNKKYNYATAFHHSRRVWEEYKMYYQCGIKFVGYELFKNKITSTKLFLKWGAETIERIYNMLTYHENEYYGSKKN